MGGDAYNISETPFQLRLKAAQYRRGLVQRCSNAHSLAKTSLIRHGNVTILKITKIRTLLSW